MTILGLPILTTVVFLPLVGVVALLFLSRNLTTLARWIALGTSGLTFLVSLPLYWAYNAQAGGFQMVEKINWIPAWGAEYHLAMDGVSMLLVLLTTLLTVLAIVSTWHEERHVRELMIALLLLEVGMTGVFLTLDVLMFYVFWEIMLFPMYFLIGVWGSDRRLYAAIKFVVYTMVASVLMLVAILYMYFAYHQATGLYSFNLLEWYKVDIALNAQYWLFAAFALAFAVKVPMFPVHTWLPDAHVEAPTSGSVILAGVLLKMGTYGFFRFAMPLFPQATQAAIPFLIGLSVVGIIYGALVCMVQPDMKKLVAYSSVSHMGFVMLGLFAMNEQGIQGSMLQMLNHGISTGALFLLVGMLYERRHTKLIAEYGGLMNVMPILSTVFLIVVLSSIGLPSLNGFVGEYLILLGAFENHPVAAIISASAVILAAVYLLWMYQRVFFGKVTKPENQELHDMPLREIAVMAPLLLFIVWVGVYPKPFLDKMEPSVARFMEISRMEKTLKPRPQPESQGASMSMAAGMVMPTASGPVGARESKPMAEQGNNQGGTNASTTTTQNREQQ